MTLSSSFVKPHPLLATFFGLATFLPLLDAGMFSLLCWVEFSPNVWLPMFICNAWASICVPFPCNCNWCMIPHSCICKSISESWFHIVVYAKSTSAPWWVSRWRRDAARRHAHTSSTKNSLCPCACSPDSPSGIKKWLLQPSLPCPNPALSICCSCQKKSTTIITQA